MSVRLPHFKYQIGDPTTSLDPYICTLESGAMGLDVISGGKINVWGGNLVPYCGRSVSLIRQKGTNLDNVATAWSHWGKTLDRRRGYTWTNALNDLVQGYFVILQGDYDQFSLITRCQDSFTGDHAVLVVPEFSASGRVLMADPLCKTFKWVTQTELKNYANKLARRIYGSDWRGQIFYARIKPPVVPVLNHFAATVITATPLWNDVTKKWVYNGDNRVKVGTRLEVRGAQYVKGGIKCYPITSGKYSSNYKGYYVPVKNVRLGNRV